MLIKKSKPSFFKDQKETVLPTETFVKSTLVFRNNIYKTYGKLLVIFANIFEIIGKILTGL